MRHKMSYPLQTKKKIHTQESDIKIA